MYRYLAESVAGTRHVAAGAPNQDAVDVVRTLSADGGRYLIVAVADGAGSAARSDVGAQLATTRTRQEACRMLEERSALSGDDLLACIAHAREAVLAEAGERDLPSRELACTLLVAVVGPTSALFAQLGDGAIIAGGSARGARVLPAEDAEYANVTHFLTGSDWRAHLRIVERDLPDWFALCTDGIELLSVDPRSDEPLEGFFEPFVNALRAAEDPSDLVAPLREFLESRRVNACTDDDKTLVIAVRSAG